MALPLNIHSNKYYLFLDECGDQNLSNFDPSFPIFTLCGIIVSQSQLDWISNEINTLKKEFWGDKIWSFSILHHGKNCVLLGQFDERKHPSYNNR